MDAKLEKRGEVWIASSSLCQDGAVVPLPFNKELGPLTPELDCEVVRSLVRTSHAFRFSDSICLKRKNSSLLCDVNLQGLALFFFRQSKGGLWKINAAGTNELDILPLLPDAFTAPPKRDDCDQLRAHLKGSSLPQNVLNLFEKMG